MRAGCPVQAGAGLRRRVAVVATVAGALLVVACPERAGEGTSATGASRAPAAASGEPRPTPGSAARTGARGSPGSPPSPPDESDEVETVDDEPEVDHEGACAPADPNLKPVQLLRFTFTDAVDRKDPGQKLNIARPGQRVYAHLRLRNRSGRDRCVHAVFRVGGKKRTEVTLKVGESWSWRTWAYNTLRSDDTGPLQVTVTDDQGNKIVQQQLAVVPAP